MEKSWEILGELIESGEIDGLTSFLDGLSPTETARAVSRLGIEGQERLLTLLGPEEAAEVIGDVSESQAADMIEILPPRQAAAILEELQSDRQADLLGAIGEEDAEAILQEMSPEEAEEARQLLEYPPDSAGGIMIAECLAFPQEQRLEEVLRDLRANRETYGRYHVQYLYVLDHEERLTGVLRMHDLLFAPRTALLKEVMIRDPLQVRVDAGLEELRNFFEEHKLFGVPVVDEEHRLLGVVLPAAVEHARRKRSVNQFLGFSGIVGGEEFRTMPLMLRSGRRLSWLSVNILLNIVAASVIAIYQDTLSAVIALAVFLPMISDMSGCSGNQAVAVSMRELNLGLIRPTEVMRVLRKEAALGLVNGVALGGLLGGVAFLWKGSPFLGVVVGGALAANTVLAVALGGLLPLVLKRLRMDPALVSSPILTTVTDMCGFFFVLSFATAVLPRLVNL